MVFTLISEALTQDQVMLVALDLYQKGLLSEAPRMSVGGDQVEIIVDPPNEAEVIRLLKLQQIDTVELQQPKS